MPNHITNVVKISDLGGTNLSDVHASLLNEARMVDFNKISPCPECLKDFEPDSQVLNIASVLLGLPTSDHPLISALEKLNRDSDFESYVQMSDMQKSNVLRAVENHKACGFMYWYDWNNENWGTKWNAYSQPKDGFDSDSVEFTFETAWSHPLHLIEVLSKKLPNVTFEVKFADEDTGSNCGTYTIKDGLVTNADIAPPYSQQTFEDKKKYTQFSFTLRHPNDDPKSHGYDENWEYSDEVYEAWQKEHEPA